MELEEVHLSDIRQAISLEKDAKNDPPEEPYRSQYKARELYLNVLAFLEDKLTDEICSASGDASRQKVLSMQCSLKVRLSINYYETEEGPEAQKLLENILELVEKQSDHQRFAGILQLTLNQLGVFWSSLNDMKKAEDYLRRSEKLYKSYQQNESVGAPPCFEEMFGLNEASRDENCSESFSESEFETNYTMTLYYLAQVLQSTDRTEEAATYCHATLKRQMQRSQYEAVDWALNAATLSQVYITRGQFAVARHCVSAASSVLFNIQEPESESDTSESYYENLNHAKANLQRCWVKYGLNLLQQSFDQFSYDTKTDPEKIQIEVPEDLQFDMQLSKLEDAVACEYATCFDEARGVFMFIQAKITEAKKYFTIETCCSDYVELTQDHSSAFKLLALFELDLERQSRMQKRRVDMLKEIVALLSSQHYLLLCRQLYFELGEVLSGMVDLKMALIQQCGTAGAELKYMKKVNSLCVDAIAQFEKYLSLFRRPDGSQPDSYPADDTRAALLAFFYCGRLHSKFIETDPRRRVQKVQRSLDCYKRIVDYCAAHPESAECVKTELELSSEMVLLLPVKMQQIVNKEI